MAGAALPRNVHMQCMPTCRHTTRALNGRHPACRLEPSYGDGWSGMEYPDWAPEAYDCTDSSADIWKTLLPLAAAADNSPADPATSSQGLDLIAP